MGTVYLVADTGSTAGSSSSSSRAIFTSKSLYFRDVNVLFFFGGTWVGRGSDWLSQYHAIIFVHGLFLPGMKSQTEAAKRVHF